MRQGLPTETVDPNIDQFNSIEPTVTFADSVGAAYDEAKNDTFVMQLARRNSLNELSQNGMKDLTPEDANKKYPGLDVPFNKPVNPLVAREVFDRHVEQMERQRLIEKGPDNIGASISRFGAGMLAHVMDPIETGIGMLAGFGTGAALAKAAPTVAATTVGKFGAEAAGNLVQAVATEVGNKAIGDLEQKKFDPIDAMTNIATNTFALPLAFAGARGILKGSKFAYGKVSEMFSNLSPEHSALVAKTAVNNLEHNIVPNIEPIKQKIAMDTNIKPEDISGVKGPNATYNFEKATSLEGKTMYVSSSTTDFNGKMKIGDDFGEGVYMTDNPQVANANVVRGLGEGTGSIVNAGVEGANLLDLNNPLPENVIENFKKFIPEEELRGISGRDALENIKAQIGDERIPQDTLETLKMELQAKGYDGVIHDGTKVAGYDHNPHNTAILWNEDKIKTNGIHPPDDRVVGKVSTSTLENAPQSNRDVTLDKSAYEKFKIENMADDRPINPEVKKIAEQNQALQEQLDSLEKQGFLDSSEKAGLEAIRQQFKDIDLHDTLIKASEVCLTKGA